MWMNEVHFSTNDRTLEVAALAGAQINYAFIDVLTVDADAGITSRRALATDCTRSLDNSLAGGPVIDIFTCRNFAASISVRGVRARGLVACPRSAHATHAPHTHALLPHTHACRHPLRVWCW